jgi:4-hydroxybenzoate polyprenyltransferase
MPDSLSTLRAMWITMRPYLLFVSGITGVTGMALGAGSGFFPPVTVFIASFFAYGFGQALTDCFQTDTDALSAPYRPLVAGKVSRGAILAMSLVGLTGCVIMLAIGNPWNVLVGAIAGAGLATYTIFKRRWWGGPWYNAWIVAALCFMAYLSVNENPLAEIPAPLIPMLAAVFFGYANFVLSGYFKDIDADAATGYYTLPVVFGRRTAAIASDVIAALFLTSTVWAAKEILRNTQANPLQFAGLLFVVPGATLLINAQMRLHRNRVDSDAHAPIGLVVHAYILLLSGLAAMLHPAWTMFLIGHYVLFIVVFAHRPEAAQI